MRTNRLSLTNLANLNRMNAIQMLAGRTGLVVVATEPPVDFQSQEQFQLLLPNPEPKPGPQADQGSRDQRLPGTSGSPAGSVGRHSGATACRASRTTAARFVTSAASARASDYPSPTVRSFGDRTRRATPSYRRWHPANVPFSTAGK